MARQARRGTPSELVVVGLGNPGARYEGTRHNVGADAVALLAERAGDRLRPSKDEALMAEARLDGRRVLLAFPTTYMNDSGRSVVRLWRRGGQEDTGRLVIVHDELDLPPGRVKVKVGGGLAGHNGLRSVEAHLHTRDFTRVRIGVGKPPGGKEQGAGHVLSKTNGATKELLAAAVVEAADAVELILTEGVDAAMARVNAK
ncbi:MAG: aminoacyl-tRNA hydrolase [Microthrixaceae bacterium]